MKYLLTIILVLACSHAYSMQNAAQLLETLKKIPATRLNVEMTWDSAPKDTWLYVTNKDELRTALVSITDALRLEGETLVISLDKIKTPIYETLLALPTQKTVKPYTVTFSCTPEEKDAIELRHYTGVKEALEVHLGTKPQETYITANWSLLRELFTQEKIIEVETEKEVIKEVVKKEKIRPSLRQKLIDPVTLCTTGLVGALVWWAKR